ncbi:MAG TPA: undecaprenyldiphospho-muramoylpentapeptide beta-N-acetylglucosaminyltransferase [Stellaceae bacterium]|nr:undecaprenyldiphospho-muramoylpentapeptide beta-N-acetylglucosaminyltransferase [Stellaceae bacterium]
MSRLIVLAAGGTGGHLFPAEALARELMARGFRVALVTDRRGQAFGDKLPGVELHRIRAGRFGAGLMSKVVGVAELALGTLEAGRLLRMLSPAAVVGFGGYPSVPTMLAAARLGLPTAIHEQNAILGRANRLLAPRVKRIATSFAELGGVRDFDRTRLMLTGNPVRPAIAALRGTPYRMPGDDTGFDILVLGGSQGARVLSEVVPAAFALLPEPLRRRLRITQQARPEDIEAVRVAHRASGTAAELAPFFNDVPERLVRAHLVISRAGASTMAELTMVGRPAILVPYLHAADDHQTANARALEQVGGAWVIPQAAFTAEGLAEMLRGLIAEPERLARAAATAHAQGRPDAARDLADLIVAALGNGHPAPRERAA